MRDSAAGEPSATAIVRVQRAQGKAKGDVEAPEAPLRAADEPPQPAGPSLSYLDLFRYATPRDKLTLLCGLVAAVAGGSLFPLYSMFLGDLLNAIGNPFNPDPMRDVRRIVVKIACLGVGGLAAGYIEITCCTISGRNLASTVRHRFLMSVLKQDAAWHETSGTQGSIIRGLNEDTQAVQESVGDRLGNFVRNLSTFVAALIVSFTRGWQLSLVMCATFPFLAGVSVALSVANKKLQAVVMAASARANGIVQQALSAIRTVVSYGMEPSVAAKYDGELDEPERAGVKQSAYSALVTASTNATYFLSVALCAGYGSIRVADGTYSGGDVLGILSAMLLGGFALGQTMPHLKHFSVGVVSAGQLYAIINRKPDIDADAPGTILPEVRGDIELEGVVFAYPARPDRRVFDGFALTISAGTSVALVGESGSGKSTIIQLVQRFYDPAAGAVLLDGHDVRTLQLRWMRSQMALVSQEPTLFNTTVHENIASSRPGATREEVEAAATAANAHEFIVRLPNGYDTPVGERGGQLSGGQRQRIAIARALLRDPKILLLDEATSALDAQSELIVQDALENLMGGRTVVMIAHRLSTIVDCDNIAVVRGGQVVEQGRHDVLMSNEDSIYAGMVARQQIEEAGAGSLRDQFAASGKLASSKSLKRQATLRPSVLKRTSVRLSVIPANIAKLLKGQQGKTEVDEGASVTRRLYSLNRPEWRYALVGVLASVLLGAEMPGFAYALSNMTTVLFEVDPDDVKSGGRTWALIFVGIALATLGVTTFQGWCFGVMGQRLARRVKNMYLQAVLRQEMGWFDSPDNGSGEILSRLSVDINALKGAVGDALGALCQYACMFLIGFVWSMCTCWSMTLVQLAALPLLVLALLVAAAQAYGYYDNNNAGAAQANQIATEAVGAIKVVAAYSLQGQVAQLYRSTVEEGATNRSAHISGLAFGMSQLILFLYYCLGFWFGTTRIQSGDTTFSSMIQAYNFMLYVAFGLAAAGGRFPTILKAGPAARRVFALIDRQPLIDIAKAGPEPPISGEVQLKNVTFAYPARPGRLIFKHFNLRVEAGTSCALVGESGHGKSTIIGLLERFYDPVDGQVLVDGISVKNFGLKYLRSQIGLVGQEPVMFNATILENIRIGNPNATMPQVIEAARVANAVSFVERLPEGFDTRLGEGGMQLSGGQKQRIAIARAVLRNPRILMLDEATAALDAESEKLVQDALDVAMAGRTTFVVAHRLSTVVHCTKIAAIYRGRVLEEGSHAQLMQLNGYYAYLVAASST